jgi:hypothetical protein
MNVKSPNVVGSAYEDFLEAFRIAVEDAGLVVKFPDKPVRACFSQAGEKYVFDRCLYLQGWPSRRLSKDKRLDIVIRVLETFTQPRWLLTKSTVYLNYLVISNSKAVLAQSLHYDFVDGGQTNHPFFHVQLDTEPIPEVELRSTGFDLELNLPDQLNECWVTTRIPTPDMTIASVLYCLVADHLGADIFKQFAENVHSVQDRLPLLSFDPIKNGLQRSDGHFKSSHWFAHMHE